MPPIRRAQLEMQFEQGTPIKGRYRVESRLGEGGQGIVYKVMDLENANQPRAVKILFCDAIQKRDEGQEALARFASEYAILRKLDHPNVIRVSDAGQVPDAYYFIAMEFVAGGTLASRLDRARKANENIPIPEVLRTLHQIALGLEAAHKAGIMHRDLKPANVLVTDTGQIKLLDFGLARDTLTGVSLTANGRTVGTIAYMSPEQLTRAVRVDARTDIYSLGILAYELVTTRHPYAPKGLEWTNEAEIIQSHLHKSVPDFAEGNRYQRWDRHRLPWLEEFIRVCTERDRRRRFQSTSEVVCFLEARMAALGLLSSPRVPDPLWIRLLGSLVFGGSSQLRASAS
ncbi:serine/threonine protein kinase [bacterium]|nr:serine/threonine protein kinase [bacterium]